MIITILAVTAGVMAVVAIKKHLTLVQVKADINTANTKLSALVAKGVAATKADVSAAIADLKKWI